MQPNTMNARQLLEDARATAKARIDAGGPRLLSPATVFDAAKDEASKRSPLIDSRRRRRTDCLRDHTTDWLKDHNSQRP